VAAAPAPPPAPAAPAIERSLFERVGSLAAITAIIDELVARATADPRIKYRFFNVNLVNLRRLFVEFTCVAAGGPCTYTGRDMGVAHTGMDLADDEFAALVEDLVGALDKFQIGDREKGEMVATLGPLRSTMVVSATRFKPIPEAKLAGATALVATLKNKDAADLLAAAIIAGRRGQRSFAEQLFSRAELVVGPRALASASEVFRDGAPPHPQTAVKAMKDPGPQLAKAVGTSEDERAIKRPERGSLRGTLHVEGKPLDGLGLVMLWPQDGAAPKRPPQFQVVEQRNKAFAPHLMAVPVGSTVAFPNFDAVYHNVFSVSLPQKFDLGLYKAGDMRQVTLTSPGIIRLGCNIHASMSAYVVVIDAPHYVVADPDGTFSFRSLRPGKYKVRAWSEQSAEPLTTEITISAGLNETALELHGGARPGPSDDKFGIPRGH